MQYASTSAMRSCGAAGQPQVPQRLVVDGEEPARRPVLRRHVPDRRAVGERERLEPVPEVLDELPDDARLAQDLRHREDEVGRGRALGERAGQPEPDDLRDEHRDRLAEHRGLGLDPADAPAEHAEAVDHRRVRVGPDERVRERDAVALVDDAREELEVDLVDDPRARRDDLEVVERALAPAQERVALAVPLELELGVPEDGAARRELVDLHRVVDHELDGRSGLILFGSPPRSCIALRIAARSTTAGTPVKSWRSTRPGRERDLLRRLRARDPAGDRLDVGCGHARRRPPCAGRSRGGSAACTGGGGRRGSPAARRGGRSRGSTPPTSSVERAPKLFGCATSRFNQTSLDLDLVTLCHLASPSRGRAR